MNPMVQQLTCVVNVSEGREDIMNPMVQNMVQGYEAAQYEYIWISTSRIKGGKQFPVIIIIKIFMAPHLLRAQNIYKDIRIR